MREIDLESQAHHLKHVRTLEIIATAILVLTVILLLVSWTTGIEPHLHRRDVIMRHDMAVECKSGFCISLY